MYTFNLKTTQKTLYQSNNNIIELRLKELAQSDYLSFSCFIFFTHGYSTFCGHKRNESSFLDWGTSDSFWHSEKSIYLKKIKMIAFEYLNFTLKLLGLWSQNINKILCIFFLVLDNAYYKKIVMKGSFMSHEWTYRGQLTDGEVCQERFLLW